MSTEPVKHETNEQGRPYWMDWRPSDRLEGELLPWAEGTFYGVEVAEPEIRPKRSKWTKRFWRQLEGWSKGDADDLVALAHTLGVEPGWWAAEALLKRAKEAGVPDAGKLLKAVKAAHAKETSESKPR
jgi:hypothetical protein